MVAVGWGLASQKRRSYESCEDHKPARLQWREARCSYFAKGNTGRINQKLIKEKKKKWFPINGQEKWPVGREVRGRCPGYAVGSCDIYTISMFDMSKSTSTSQRNNQIL